MTAMTASRNAVIERYITAAIERAVSCRTAVLEKMAGGSLSSWNSLTEVAEHDATWDLYARVERVATNNGGDWEAALVSVREAYADELLTVGVAQSTNPFSNALSLTRHQQMRHFLSDTRQFTRSIA